MTGPDIRSFLVRGGWLIAVDGDCDCNHQTAGGAWLDPQGHSPHCESRRLVGRLSDLDAQTVAVRALLGRCDELDANTTNRIRFGGSLAPALITTDEVRALLAAPVPDNTTEETRDGA